MRTAFLQVMHLAGHRNQSNENHYPNDVKIIAADRWIQAQAKLAYLVVMMAVSGLKSTQRNRLHSANKLPCIDKGLTW
jgi:hypothetical protein